MSDIILAGNIFGFDDDFDFMRLYDVSEVMIQPKRQKIKRTKLIDKTIEFETEFILEVAFRKAKPMEINELIKELESMTKKTTSDDKGVFNYLTPNEQKLPLDEALLQLSIGLQSCKTKEDVIVLLHDAVLLGKKQ